MNDDCGTGCIICGEGCTTCCLPKSIVSVGASNNPDVNSGVANIGPEFSDVCPGCRGVPTCAW